MTYEQTSSAYAKIKVSRQALIETQMRVENAGERLAAAYCVEAAAKQALASSEGLVATMRANRS